MKWVKNLSIAETEKLETRLSTILNYIFKTYSANECLLTDIDATGKYGDQLTQKLNKQETLRLTGSEIEPLLNEDGQVLELDLLIDYPKNFEIIVRDGYHVAILGDVELPPDLLGQHSNGNLEDYILDSSDNE